MSDPLEISDLPPDKQQEIIDFVEYLRNKQKQKPKNKMQFQWEGCIEEFKDQYTSLELQKKALEWRD